MNLCTRGARSTARGVVISAGAYGLSQLAQMRCKARSALPKLVGHARQPYVRTNSEALVTARARDDAVDYSRGIAITSGVMVDDQTHVRGRAAIRVGSDAIAPLTLLLTDRSRGPRWLHVAEDDRCVIP